MIKKNVQGQTQNVVDNGRDDFVQNWNKIVF